MSSNMTYRLPQGAICVLNDRCNNKKLLSTGARYFLVLEHSDPYMVETVPVFTTQRNPPFEIRINKETYWISIDPHIMIPFDFLWLAGSKQLNNSQNVLATIKKIQERARPQKDVSDGKTLYIYKGRIICHQRNHPIIPVTATFYDKRGKKVKIDVEYCKSCNRLMMNYISFDHYRKKHGVLIRDLRMVSHTSFDGKVYLADESPLKLCGYSVAQSQGLTESSRHYILAKIIHDGILTKNEVICYLAQFILVNGEKEGNWMASIKWQNDLDFVHEYNIDIQPEFYITSVKKY